MTILLLSSVQGACANHFHRIICQAFGIHGFSFHPCDTPMKPAWWFWCKRRIWAVRVTVDEWSRVREREI